jgi:hypothetical protein
MRGVCIRLACAGWLRWGLCVCALAPRPPAALRARWLFWGAMLWRAPGQLYPF